jgi:spore germination protein
MARRLALAIAILILAAVPAGCWDSQDISDLNTPITAGYDVPDPVRDASEPGAMVVATNLVPNLDPEAEEKVRVDRVAARTIGESRGIRSEHNPDLFKVGMIQVIIYGENLARRGLNDVTDILFREPKMKRAVLTAVVDGRADELLEMECKNTTNLGVYLIGLLKHAQERSFIPSVDMTDFGTDVNATGKNPVLPLLTTKGGQRVELAGAGIFKKDKLVAKIPIRETRTLVLLRGLHSSGTIPFVIAGDGSVPDRGTVDVKNSRQVRVERDGDQITFLITVKLEGRLVEHTRRELFIEEEEMMQEIDRAVAEEIRKDCASFVTRMQGEFGVDCIDITKYALARWRSDLKDKVEDDDFIKKAKIVVDVQVDIRSTGERA